MLLVRSEPVFDAPWQRAEGAQQQQQVKEGSGVMALREVLEQLEIPIRPGVCRVLRVQRTKSGRSWLVRVGVEVDGAVSPMRVLVPRSSAARPVAGRQVRFEGLRVVFHTSGGRCRAVVLADRVEEVAGDVAA